MKNRYFFKKFCVLFLLIIAFIGVFILGACSTTKTSAKSTSSFDIKHKDEIGSYQNVYVLTDNETKREYIVVDNDYSGAIAITPRLDKR